MEERNTEEALKWIVGLLKKHDIAFQISGGFAVRLYGSDRELHDIDIGVPDDGLQKLHDDVKDYITFGPEKYSDSSWNLQLMSLKYKGQKIDLAGRDTISFFDRNTMKWIPGHRDLTNFELKEIYGLEVPVIPKESLVAYKNKLGRDVDLIDVAFLESI
jgi:hypothetical protein